MCGSYTIDELDSRRPPAVIYCFRNSICVMDLPALWTILVLHRNGLVRLRARSCWHRNWLAVRTTCWPYGHRGWPSVAGVLAYGQPRASWCWQRRDIRTDIGTRGRKRWKHNDTHSLRRGTDEQEWDCALSFWKTMRSRRVTDHWSGNASVKRSLIWDRSPDVKLLAKTMKLAWNVQRLAGRISAIRSTQCRCGDRLDSS